MKSILSILEPHFILDNGKVVSVGSELHLRDDYRRIRHYKILFISDDGKFCTYEGISQIAGSKSITGNTSIFKYSYDVDK
jgi:hypothetical protein